MKDPIAFALRLIIASLAALGAVSTIAIWASIPPFAGIAYLMTFALVALVGAFGL